MAIGRPRGYDTDEVLDAAMALFWAHGFAAVSMSDVCAATGVNRRSVYAEFTSKEALFARVARRYVAGPARYQTRALAASSALGVAAAMVHGAADTVAGGPGGCLLVGDAPGLAELREDVVRGLTARFAEFAAGGELAGTDPALLARWIVTICQGLAVQSRTGVDAAELHRLADLALAGWPPAAGRPGPAATPPAGHP